MTTISTKRKGITYSNKVTAIPDTGAEMTVAGKNFWISLDSAGKTYGILIPRNYMQQTTPRSELLVLSKYKLSIKAKYLRKKF